MGGSRIQPTCWTRAVKARMRTFLAEHPASLHTTSLAYRYDLAYIFGGGEFFMELVETITEVPAFDSAWLDFCKYYNASDDE